MEFITIICLINVVYDYKYVKFNRKRLIIKLKKREYAMGPMLEKQKHRKVQIMN